MTDRKNVIKLNIKGFSVQGRLEIYPWMIILIISWPSLASLTSNLSSPIFKGKVPQITSLTKKFNSTEMSWRSFLIWKMSRNLNLLSNQSNNYCTVVKNAFFHYFDDFRCHILANKNSFFPPYRQSKSILTANSDSLTFSGWEMTSVSFLYY